MVRKCIRTGCSALQYTNFKSRRMLNCSVAMELRSLSHFMEQPVNKDIVSCDKSYKLLHKCQKFAKSIRFAINVCFANLNIANIILWWYIYFLICIRYIVRSGDIYTLFL